MYPDLLVATTGQGDDAAAFAVACALARAGGGHVAVLVQERVGVPPDAGLGFFAASAYVEFAEQVRRDAEAACARWRDALRDAGVPGEVRQVGNVFSRPALTAAVHARHADLAIVGLGPAGAPIPLEVHDQIATLLEASGRPVLAVPPGTGAPGFGRIAIAWRPGANAARAVHDALPLLRQASVVDVLCVDPVPSETGHGDDPGADIARHLARHGLPVTVHVVAGSGDEPGEALLRRVRELGADLLVMGGYSRSRLREWVFGGTTRHVLGHATLPVLLSH